MGSILSSGKLYQVEHLSISYLIYNVIPDPIMIPSLFKFNKQNFTVNALDDWTMHLIFEPFFGKT